MRMVLLFIPVHLWAQCGLLPWSPWENKLSKWEVYIEHYGFGEGWNTCGIRRQSSNYSLQIQSSSKGKLSLKGLGRVRIDPNNQVLVGFDLANHVPQINGQWSTNWNEFQHFTLQICANTRSLNMAITFQELTENGWLLGVTALALPNQMSEIVGYVQFPGSERLGRIYTSTTGNWAVELNIKNMRFLFGGLYWPWFRTTLFWDNPVIMSSPHGTPTK